MEDERGKVPGNYLIVTIVLFSIGCYIGKLLMDKYGTWISFNGPAIGILLAGEALWWKIRKWLMGS